MTIKVGDKLPSVKMMRWGEKGPEAVTSEELFKGKKVALFGVPGAFTPTCSAKHLPICPERRCSEGKRRGSHCLHVRQRRVRDERLGQGSELWREGDHGRRRRRSVHESGGS